MTSWETLKLFGSAVLPPNHVYRLATAGALLTCFAVAFNIGPFAKPSKPEAGMSRSPRGSAPNATAALSPPVSKIDARFQGFQLAMEEDRDAEQTAPPAAASSETWPVAAADVPIPVSRPTLPTDRSRDAQEVADVEETASIDNASIVGVWAPNAGTCSAREFRDGTLPAIISAEGAWAGETFCLFSSKKQIERGWSVVAKCTSPKEHWTARVRLTVKENRLTWTSKRGTQAYSRCAPDVLMAAAR